MSAQERWYRVISPDGEVRQSVEGFAAMTDYAWLDPQPGDTVESAVLDWKPDFVVGADDEDDVEIADDGSPP